MTQPAPFTVVIAPGLWRGFEVSVEPPTATHPLRTFRQRADALAHAKELARLQGWPLLDRSGEHG